MYVHTGGIVRNEKISNRDVHVKFTRYLSEPFPREGDTRPRGEPRRGREGGWEGGTRKKACKNRTQASRGDLYCINVIPRDFVKYSTHVVVTATLWWGFLSGTMYVPRAGVRFVTLTKKSPGSTKQSITGPVVVMLTSRDVIDVRNPRENSLII